MIVFENNRFLKKRFETGFLQLFFEGDRFWENDCFWKNFLLTIMLKIVNEGSSLTIVNEGLSLKIVHETTNFIKTVVFGKTIVFEKKLHANLRNVVLHEVKQFWGS